MGMGNDGSSEQKRYNRQQEQKQREEKAAQQKAIANIYSTFGLDGSGNPVTEKPGEWTHGKQPGTMADLDLGGKGPGANWNAINSSIADRMAWIENYGDEYSQHNRDTAAYDNYQDWQGNLDQIYDDVAAVHTRALNDERGNVSDALMTQLIRQGMMGSHLTDQYEYQVDDAYQNGLARVDSVASGARSGAESNLNTIMNDAVAQVHAGNTEAANTGVLRNQIGSAFQTASDSATGQAIGGFFDNILKAYEMRRQNKGDYAAENSYYSAPGYSGTVSGGR